MSRAHLTITAFILAIQLAAPQTQCPLKSIGIRRYYECTYSTTYSPKNQVINIPNNAYKEVSVIFTSSYIQSLNTDLIKLPTTTHSLIYLTIIRSKLTTIADNALKTFPKLQTLNLSDNSISRLDRLDFNGPVNLTTLNISRNNISIIDDMAFGEQTALQILDLSHNSLPSINNSHFNSTHFLKTLDLSYNAIKTIEAEAFNGLVNLIELNLDHNKITRLENRFAHLSMLQELYLSGNGLSVTSASFLGLKWLERLDLSGNGIENISWELFKYTTSLKVLDLSDNQISDFNISSLAMGTLRNVSIHKNIFACDELLALIKKFKVVEVAVMQGPDVDEVNVFGIGCNSSTVVFEGGIDKGVGLKVVDNSTGATGVGVGEGSTVILLLLVAILILVVAQFFMGHCWRRRRMDSRNIKELEGIL